MSIVFRLIFGLILLAGACFIAPQQANAQAVDGCSTNISATNYHVECNNSCTLNEYFQYIFNASYRPYRCNSIPPAFWVYQTQVGNVSSGGKSSSGAASSASAAASSSASTPMATMTPSSQISAGATYLGYAPSAQNSDASKAIDGELAYADEPGPALEKAIWIKLLGTLGEKDKTKELASIDIESGGVMIGADLYSNEWFRFGLIGSVTDVSVRINENNNKIDMTAYKGGATATLEIGKWYLDGLGTYSLEDISTERTVDLNGFGDFRDMWSNFSNERINTAFETGFRLTAGRLVIQPLAGVNMNWMFQEEVREKGNDSASVLTAENTIYTGASKVGLNLSTAFVGDRVSIVPTIGGSWSRRFGDLENAHKISTDQGVSYEYVGEKPLLDIYNVFGSLLINVDEHLAISAGYQGSFNRDERYHSGNVNLRVRF